MSRTPPGWTWKLILWPGKTRFWHTVWTKRTLWSCRILPFNIEENANVTKFTVFSLTHSYHIHIHTCTNIDDLSSSLSHIYWYVIYVSYSHTIIDIDFQWIFINCFWYLAWSIFLKTFRAGCGPSDASGVSELPAWSEGGVVSSIWKEKGTK